jgi:1-acyl-sn-glycerol-3-phosphate acyltransferase
MSVLNIFQLIAIFICTFIAAIIASICLIFSKKVAFLVSKNIWAKTICKIVKINIQISNDHLLTKETKPIIFCANHQSNFDIIALFIAIDRPIYFIAKKELKKIPFLGWYMQLAGMIFIDRSDRKSAIESMEEAGKLILNGRNVITFPEGKRSTNIEIKAFKKGSFFIAKQNNINIIPIAIHGSNKINRPGSFQLKKGVIKINFGKKIISNSYNSIEELTQQTRQEVIKLQNEIL